MKNTIQEQLSRIKELMLIKEQATTGCTQGDCSNGTGTYVWDDGYKYVGTFKDGWVMKGVWTFPSSAKEKVSWENSGPSRGKFQYTNAKGFVFPRAYFYRNQDSEVFNDSSYTIPTDYTGLTWEKSYQCAASGSKLIMDNDANNPVRLRRNYKDSQYTFYKDGKYVQKQGNNKIGGTYSCSGNIVNLKDSSGNESKLEEAIGSYLKCDAFPINKGCYNKTYITKVQECLGFTGKWIDGKYGSETEKKLKEKGYETTITQEVYDKIVANCGKENPKEEPKPEEEKKKEGEDKNKVVQKQEDPFKNWTLIEPDTE